MATRVKPQRIQKRIDAWAVTRAEARGARDLFGLGGGRVVRVQVIVSERA